ncbi:hypothetical protein M0805_001051 [Coniferiporia weirii]|nr:hypothetical protein M0805_001051 [Coniferiporia weirii]
MAPSGSLTVALASALTVYLAYLYIRLNDRRLTALPPAAAAASPHRWTDREIRAEHARMRANPIDILSALPPRTGRRYIVVGGAGFLGGWLVVHLLRRGENPARIRVLDVRAPTRADLLTGAAAHVDFRICDISDASAVNAAFCAPWPDTDEDGEPEVTVFHTAATIRFYERAWSLVPLSAAVNVQGTQNVLDAARAVGATVLVSTSSGSVCVRRSRFWLWPWEHAPPLFVQAIDDRDDAPHLPRRHGEFFSNYAYTKHLAEGLVRGADGSPSGAPGASMRTLRTGCLRPGNGIFGPGGDVLCGAALVREHNPTWIASVMQNFVYVENASLAHLCYEQRLLALSASPDTHPADVGGQAFCIADAGPPPTYGDVYRALSVLTAGRATFPTLSTTGMLLLAQIIEPVYLFRHFLLRLGSPLRALAHLVPRLPGDLLNLQPSLFALVCVHMLFDDSRARAAPTDGGLGYAPRWTTLQGLCTLVDEFERGGRAEEARQRAGGGISFGMGKLGELGRFWRPKGKAAISALSPASAVQSWSVDVNVGVDSGAHRKAI